MEGRREAKDDMDFPVGNKDRMLQVKDKVVQEEMRWNPGGGGFF